MIFATFRFLSLLDAEVAGSNPVTSSFMKARRYGDYAPLGMIERLLLEVF